MKIPYVWEDVVSIVFFWFFGSHESWCLTLTLPGLHGESFETKKSADNTTWSPHVFPNNLKELMAQLLGITYVFLQQSWKVTILET